MGFLGTTKAPKGLCWGCKKSLEGEFRTRYCGDCSERAEYLPTPGEIIIQMELMRAERMEMMVNMRQDPEHLPFYEPKVYRYVNQRRGRMVD